MLVLSRKAGQRIVIDDKITIVVNRIVGNRVSLGIEAPEDVHIMRGELQKIRQEFADETGASDRVALPLEIQCDLPVDFTETA